MHHRAKLCQNQSMCSGDIALFQFLAWDVIYTSRAYATVSVSVCLSVTEVNWRIIANLGFIFRSKFTAHYRRGEGSSRAMPATAGPSCSIWWWSGLYRVRRLGILETPTKKLDGLYHSAKFGCNRWSSFDNIKVSIFGMFGWKILFMPLPLKNCFGGFNPTMGAISTESSQKTHACRSPCHKSHWAWKSVEWSNL